MKFLKNRKFDPIGLGAVLLNVFIPIVTFGILASMICYPKFWGIVLVIGLIVGTVYTIIYGIWKAFNLIFPKKEIY